LTGIKEGSVVNPDTTLGDLGLDSLMGVEVKQTLERDHDINLPITEVRLLTFARLDQLSNSSSHSTTSATSNQTTETTASTTNDATASAGYELRNLVSSQSVVKLNVGGGTTEGGDERVPLFVVHPVEGTVVSMESVMSQVNTVVYGLQFTEDAPRSSIEDLAAYYIQVSLKQELTSISIACYIIC